MAGPTNEKLLMHRLIVAFALCFALSVAALPSKEQMTSAPEVRVKAIIYPQVLADAIRLHVSTVIPVAILSSETFDSRNVDTESLTLTAPALNLVGRSNAAGCQETDVNGDGLVDLLCQFDLARVPTKSGVSITVLQGKIMDGTGIRAEMAVNIIPDPSSPRSIDAANSSEMLR